MTARPCRPDVPLLDDEPVVVEPEQGRPRERLHRSVGRGYDGPPIHSGARALDDRSPEATLSGSLICERPGRVLGGHLSFAMWVRPEGRVLGIEGGDRLGVRVRPRLRPDRGPVRRRGTCVYFATSIARLSRITITLT